MGAVPVTEQRDAGVLDTCTYLDLGTLDPESLPIEPAITVVTLAELHQGVAMARDPETRAVRNEHLGAAIVNFDPLPLDDAAAARYGTLVALTLAAHRNPRPRRMDLLIAATASARQLPLYTRNSDDFRGLESMVEIIPL